MKAVTQDTPSPRPCVIRPVTYSKADATTATGCSQRCAKSAAIDPCTDTCICRYPYVFFQIRIIYGWCATLQGLLTGENRVSYEHLSSHDPGLWRTETWTDGRTDGQRHGWTDGRTVQHITKSRSSTAERNRNCTGKYCILVWTTCIELYLYLLNTQLMQHNNTKHINHNIKAIKVYHVHN